MKLAFNQEEAAEALGIGVNTFKERVRPELKCVYIGRRRLFPVTEIQRWLDRNSHGL